MRSVTLESIINLIDDVQIKSYGEFLLCINSSGKFVWYHMPLMWTLRCRWLRVARWRWLRLTCLLSCEDLYEKKINNVLLIIVLAF